MKAVPVEKITNGLVVELVTLGKLQRQPWDAILKWLERLHGKNWPQIQPLKLTLVKRLTDLHQKHRKFVLAKNPKRLDEFSATTFNLPRCQKQSLKLPNHKRKLRRRSLIHRTQYEIYRKVTKCLSTELHSTIEDVNSLQARVYTLEKKVAHLNTRNTHKREQRKQTVVEKQSKRLAFLEEENSTLKQKNYFLQEQKAHLLKQHEVLNDRWKRYKKSVAKSRRRNKSRLHRLKNKHIVPSSLSESSDSDHETDVDNDARIKELEVQVDEQAETIKELQSREIMTLDKGHYNYKIRECCMKLLSSNVSIRNVEDCIKAVCGLAGQQIGKLPSKSTIANLMVEARSVAHLQLAEAIPKENTNTLHSDGTTKFGKKYGGLQVSTVNSSYTLCLTEMKAGSAKDFKILLERALSDVDIACCRATKDATTLVKAKQILASIKNTMSDRHIVEKNFNKLVEAYRAEVLPDIISGWDTLTCDQQSSLSKMNNFFCGLHFLVALADTSSETLKQWETLHSDDAVSSESGTLRLVRTACKAIQKHCSQKAGCHVMFRAYLKTKGVSIFPIATFEGNRFNIVFYNAAGIYYLRSHLIRYLEEVHHTRNKLLQAVLCDLKHPLYLVGCHALGIVSKCITSPLWRILESSISMSELCLEYQRMYELFLEWSDDVFTLLDGKGLEEVDTDDQICHELLQNIENKELLSELLQMLCKSFSLLSERLLGDHLRGGIYREIPAEDLDQESAAVPKTNCLSERDFAVLDR